MTAQIRPAFVSDVPDIFHVRTSVRENHLSLEQLAQMGITKEAVAGMIASSPCAWVAIVDDLLVGFSMIDMDEASLFAAFVLPTHEGRGLGRKLVLAAEEKLFERHEEIWLETGRNTRALGFYRRLGWGNATDAEHDQFRLTKTRA
jgi:ribosomal protein S18 acetylase RimI-like enzyme